MRPVRAPAPAAAPRTPSSSSGWRPGTAATIRPLSPRQVLLAHYVKPPFVPEHLDIFVESMLSTRIGE